MPKDRLRYVCSNCGEASLSWAGKCPQCGGSGQITQTGGRMKFNVQCPHCQGTGIIRSVESVALAVLRALEDQLLRDGRTSVTAVTTADVALYILNNKRAFVTDMERRYGIVIAVQASDRMQGANFAIERSSAPVTPQRNPTNRLFPWITSPPNRMLRPASSVRRARSDPAWCADAAATL